MEIGEIIRHYREKKGFTQKELGEKIHVSQRTIGHYETGERSPHVKVLGLLAKALDVKTEDFFKPIKEEVVKYRYYDHAWLYHYDEEKGMHELLDDSHFKEDIIRRYLITHIGKDIVYFFAGDFNEAIKGDMDKSKPSLIIRGEEIPVVRLMDSLEKGYVIVRKMKGGKEIKAAIPVDEFVESVDGIQTCHHLNEITRERERQDKELDMLNLTCLNLRINSARVDNKKMYYYSKCLHDFIESVRNNYSRKILLAIIREMINVYNQIPKDIEKEIKKVREKDKEMFPEAFERKELIGYNLEEIQAIIQSYKNELESNLFIKYRLIEENIEQWQIEEESKKNLILAIHDKNEEEIKNILTKNKMINDDEERFGGFDEEGVPYLTVQLDD